MWRRGEGRKSSTEASNHSVPQKITAHSTRQVRLSGLSRNRRVCSADNERHSLSIRARCSFFVASVPVRVGRKDLWACSKLKSSTHLQRSRCLALPKRKPRAEGAHWKAAHCGFSWFHLRRLRGGRLASCAPPGARVTKGEVLRYVIAYALRRSERSYAV